MAPAPPAPAVSAARKGVLTSADDAAARKAGLDRSRRNLDTCHRHIERMTGRVQSRVRPPRLATSASLSGTRWRCACAGGDRGVSSRATVIFFRRAEHQSGLGVERRRRATVHAQATQGARWYCRYSSYAWAHICIDRELHGLAVLERAARAELAEVQHLPQPLHCNLRMQGQEPRKPFLSATVFAGRRRRARARAGVEKAGWDLRRAELVGECNARRVSGKRKLLDMPRRRSS